MRRPTRSVAVRRLDGDRAAVGLDDRPADRQAEPDRSALGSALEGPEQPLDVRGVEPEMREANTGTCSTARVHSVTFACRSASSHPYWGEPAFTAHLVADGVQDHDVPGAEVEGVVAVAALVGGRAPVGVVTRRPRGGVLAVARRRVRDVLVRAPRGMVRGVVVGEGALVVLEVSDRDHGVGAREQVGRGRCAHRFVVGLLNEGSAGSQAMSPAVRNTTSAASTIGGRRDREHRGDRRVAGRVERFHGVVVRG